MLFMSDVHWFWDVHFGADVHFVRCSFFFRCTYFAVCTYNMSISEIRVVVGAIRTLSREKQFLPQIKQIRHHGNSISNRAYTNKLMQQK